MILLDTGTLLALGRLRAARPQPALAAWAESVSAESLFLSAVSLIDLDTAAHRLGSRDRGGGGALAYWIDERVMPAFKGRILAVDTGVARRRAQLPQMPLRDALLAATALEHRLTLATRRAAAFKGSRVKTVDPWRYRPETIDDDSDWTQAVKAGPQWLRGLFVRG